MKKTFTVFILFVLIISCKKGEKDPVPAEETYTDQIILNDLDIQGDTVKLSWSKLDTASFIKYVVARRDFDGAELYAMGNEIQSKETTEAVDVNVPYSPDVTYQILGYLSDDSIIFSNAVNYHRPDITALDLIPFDVIYHPEDDLLYFFERPGRISIYDLKAKQVTKQIDTGGKISFSDFEVYQGREELYVPRDDGWVFIYDARTLEKVDEINIGATSSSVISNNNILFISNISWIDKTLKVYNRATKQVISQSGGAESVRFKKIPHSSTKLLGARLGSGHPHYYQFDANGSIENNFYGQYSDYGMSANIFEVFPNGEKYIMSSNGAIFNIDLSYDKSLPRGSLRFMGFAFNQQGDLIYGATTTRSIEVYSTRDFEHIKTIPTKAYPFRIFVTDDAVISVSLASLINGEVDHYSFYGLGNKVIMEVLNK